MCKTYRLYEWLHVLNILLLLSQFRTNAVFNKQSTALDGKDSITSRSSLVGKHMDTITSTSSLAGQHTDRDNNQSSMTPLSPAQGPHPSLPFGSYSQHIYDLMPSLSNPVPIFENLDGVLGPDGVLLHSLATKDTIIYSSPILPKAPIPEYAVLEESIVSSRSPSPEKKELEYSYAAVRRTLTRSFEGTGKDIANLQPNHLADSST